MLTPEQILKSKKIPKKQKIVFMLFFFMWIAVANIIGFHVMRWWIDERIENYMQTHGCLCQEK